MPKKILRINGQDVELSGSGGGATQGIVDATDWAVQYLQNGGATQELMKLFYAWSGTIAELGYASAEELIRHANDITIFVDYAAILNAAGSLIEEGVEQGVFLALKLASLSKNHWVAIVNRENVPFLLQDVSLTISDCDARLGEEVKYMAQYDGNLVFLVGETRVCSVNLNA